MTNYPFSAIIKKHIDMDPIHHQPTPSRRSSYEIAEKIGNFFLITRCKKTTGSKCWLAILASVLTRMNMLSVTAFANDLAEYDDEEPAETVAPAPEADIGEGDAPLAPGPVEEAPAGRSSVPLVVRATLIPISASGILAALRKDFFLGLLFKK